MDLDENLDENLDLEWIGNFEKENKLYNKFNLEGNKYIKIQYIYINSENNIKKIKNDVLNLSLVNKVKKEELYYSIIKNKDNHRLSGIGLLVIDIKNIQDLYEDILNIEVKPISFITDIEIPTSMNIFKNINCLIILLNEKKPITINTTKKIIYKQNFNSKTMCKTRCKTRCKIKSK